MAYPKVLATLVLAIVLGFSAGARAQSTRPSEAGRPPRDGLMMLERLAKLANDPQLTDEQKQKISGFVDQARQDLASMRKPLQGLEPRQRIEKIRSVLSELREKITGVLTDEQKTQFQQKLREFRQNMQARAEGPIRRLHNAIEQLDLPANQKLQIKDVFDDARDKFQQIRKQADGDRQQVRQQGQQLAEDVRTRLQSILTPEQQQKLRGLMRQGHGLTTQVGSPSSRFGGPASEGRETLRDPSRDSSLANEASPTVGELAPDLNIRKLDGSSIQLSSYRGHVLVLEFGSYSSPSFRGRVAAMEQLHHDLGTLATFFVIYTRESHPAGTRELKRNKSEEISVEQSTNLNERRAIARKARDTLKITIPILVDDMENSAAKALGAKENSLLVVGRDGRIVARQNWADPFGARRLIEEAIHAKVPASPAR